VCLASCVGVCAFVCECECVCVSERESERVCVVFRGFCVTPFRVSGILCVGFCVSVCAHVRMFEKESVCCVEVLLGDHISFVWYSVCVWVCV